MLDLLEVQVPDLLVGLEKKMMLAETVVLDGGHPYRDLCPSSAAVLVVPPG